MPSSARSCAAAVPRAGRRLAPKATNTRPSPVGPPTASTGGRRTRRFEALLRGPLHVRAAGASSGPLSASRRPIAASRARVQRGERVQIVAPLRTATKLDASRPGPRPGRCAASRDVAGRILGTVRVAGEVAAFAEHETLDTRHRHECVGVRGRDPARRVHESAPVVVAQPAPSAAGVAGTSKPGPRTGREGPRPAMRATSAATGSRRRRPRSSCRPRGRRAPQRDARGRRRGAGRTRETARRG